MFQRVVCLALVLLTAVGSLAEASGKPQEATTRQFIHEIEMLQSYLTVDQEGFFQIKAKNARDVGVSPRTYA